MHPPSPIVPPPVQPSQTNTSPIQLKSVLTFILQWVPTNYSADRCNHCAAHPRKFSASHSRNWGWTTMGFQGLCISRLLWILPNICQKNVIPVFPHEEGLFLTTHRHGRATMLVQYLAPGVGETVVLVQENSDELKYDKGSRALLHALAGCVSGFYNLPAAGSYVDGGGCKKHYQ